MGENLHEGHRERCLAEFLKGGFSGMPQHKILEILLFYCVPRADTNPLSHELINKYGSIAGVLDAPIEELICFKGLTERGAALLKMIIPIASIYNDQKSDFDPFFRSIQEMGDFVAAKFMGVTEEKAAVLLSNPGGKFIDFKFVSDGDIGSVGLSIRSVLKLCLDKNASVVVLCHNHPSGVALPSFQDVAFTEKLSTVLHDTGINLLDHIIVGFGDYVSMAQSKEYSHIFKHL